MRPDADIAEVLASHARLLATVDGLDDAAVAQPSLLPGWDIAMVLTHLARHADGQSGGIDAAVAGGVQARYPSMEARDAAIETRRGAPATDVLDDLVASIGRLEAAWASMPDDVWRTGATSRFPDFEPEPIAELPFQRWREVEVHHADLGLGYTPADWPVALAHRWLPELLESLVGRSEPRQLMAWALGRAGAPDLEPWR